LEFFPSSPRTIIFRITCKISSLTDKRFFSDGHLRGPKRGIFAVRAEILCVILKKTVLGLDGKNYNKDVQKVEFQGFTAKNGRNTSFCAP
jgi:hypothetical protein